MTELTLEQTLDLGDYLAAFKRRRGLIASVAGIIFILGVIIAFIWPPTYKSTSTILIEAQEVPAELIQSTVTSFAAQRIQIISQRVMTRGKLVEIMDKYGLYKATRKRQTIEKILQEMRRDISVDMITASVVDPRTGRPSAASIAFTLSFKSENPVHAQKVASEMTTLFLNENLKSRTEKAAETYDFLTDEADRLNDEITSYETQLAEFKERNLNTLPESRGLNTEALARAEQEAANINLQIQGAKERKMYLEGQLPLLSEYSTGANMSPRGRLHALRNQHLSLSSHYSPDHPDIISLQREILSLEKETGDVASPDDLMNQIGALQQELTALEQTYTQEHPDVKSLKRQITALEDEFDNLPEDSDSAPAAPDNPAYVNLKTQLSTADSEVRSLTIRRTELLDRIAEYEERLLQTPKSEQAYRAITRNLEYATVRYQGVKAKQMTKNPLVRTGQPLFF